MINTCTRFQLPFCCLVFKQCVKNLKIKFLFADLPLPRRDDGPAGAVFGYIELKARAG